MKAGKVGVILILATAWAILGAANMFFDPQSLYQGKLAPALMAGCWGWLAALAVAFWIWATMRGVRQ